MVNVTTMADLEIKYKSIANKNGGKIKTRKDITSLLEEEMDDIIFSNPRRVNEPQRVSLKATVDITLANAENDFTDIGKNMRTLFEAANIIPKAVLFH